MANGTNVAIKTLVTKHPTGPDKDPDFEIIGGPHDTVYLVCPLNDKAKEYLRDIVPKDAPWLGDNLGVENHFMNDLVGALFDDGFLIDYMGQRIMGRAPSNPQLQKEEG